MVEGSCVSRKPRMFKPARAGKKPRKTAPKKRQTKSAERAAERIRNYTAPPPETECSKLKCRQPAGRNLVGHLRKRTPFDVIVQKADVPARRLVPVDMRRPHQVVRRAACPDIHVASPTRQPGRLGNRRVNKHFSARAGEIEPMVRDLAHHVRSDDDRARRQL